MYLNVNLMNKFDKDGKNTLAIKTSWGNNKLYLYWVLGFLHSPIFWETKTFPILYFHKFFIARKGKLYLCVWLFLHLENECYLSIAENKRDFGIYWNEL